VDRIRLTVDDVRLGDPLPYDVYDAEGRMLLCRGYRIESAGQLGRLIERGLYSDAADVDRGAPTGVPVLDEAPVSALARIEDARERLGRAFASQAGPVGALDLVRASADAVQDACRHEADAAIASVLVLRDCAYPIRHPVDVAAITAILLEEAGAPRHRIRAAVLGALTMNVAMLDLQNALYSQSAPLDATQRRELVAHPEAALAWLTERGADDPLWLDVVRQHHEAADGGGYPRGLRGPEIRLEAQAVSLADRYCGMVSERSYRPGASPTAALREIYLKHGSAIDPKLISLLVKVMGVYPPGTAVEIANGETAVVVRRTRNAGAPIVRVLDLADGRPSAGWPKRSTGDPIHAIRRAVDERTRALGADPHRLWPPTIAGPAGPRADDPDPGDAD
jgi:hypothetical protein